MVKWSCKDYYFLGDDAMDRTNEELCLLIQSGDQQAKQEICNKNKRLIEKVASKYVGMYGNDLDAEDLVQVGYLGLLTAAEKYDAGNEANSKPPLSEKYHQTFIYLS